VITNPLLISPSLQLVRRSHQTWTTWEFHTQTTKSIPNSIKKLCSLVLVLFTQTTLSISKLSWHTTKLTNNIWTKRFWRWTLMDWLFQPTTSKRLTENWASLMEMPHVLLMVYQAVTCLNRALSILSCGNIRSRFSSQGRRSLISTWFYL